MVTRKCTVKITSLGRLHGGWGTRELLKHGDVPILTTDLVSTAVKYNSTLVLFVSVSVRELGIPFNTDGKDTPTMNSLTTRIGFTTDISPFFDVLFNPGVDVLEPLPFSVESIPGFLSAN